MKEILDHSPSTWKQHRDATFLLSFNEFAELNHYPWLREATPQEIEEEKELASDRDDWDELMTHDTMPYMWVVVTQDAPGHVWRKATGHLRIHRFD